MTAGRLNPFGATNRFATGHRRQLFDRPGPLFEESFFSTLGAFEVTPAFAKLGGRLELQPIAMLNLAAQYDFVGSFAANDVLTRFASPGDAYDDSTLKARRDESVAVGGQALTLSALVQGKLGPIAVRDQFQGLYLEMNIDPHGPQYIYDKTLDVLRPNAGWAFTNDLDLLVLTDFGLKAGARYTFTGVNYDDAVATLADANAPTHRVGPALAYTFFEDPIGTRWNAPTLLLLAQWWAVHRYRTGEESSAALPYILVGFSQRGDL